MCSKTRYTIFTNSVHFRDGVHLCPCLVSTISHIFTFSAEGSTTEDTESVTTEPGPESTTNTSEPTTGSTSQGEMRLDILLQDKASQFTLHICILGVDCGSDRSAANCDECRCSMMDDGIISCRPKSDCGGDCHWTGPGGRCILKSG